MRSETNVMENAAAVKTSAEISYSSQLTYHEMAEVPVQEQNILEQLQSNVRTLEDLQGRLNFMMREIRYLMKV